jgi:hypothetical protein
MSNIDKIAAATAAIAEAKDDQSKRKSMEELFDLMLSSGNPVMTASAHAGRFSAQMIDVISDCGAMKADGIPCKTCMGAIMSATAGVVINSLSLIPFEYQPLAAGMYNDHMKKIADIHPKINQTIRDALNRRAPGAKPH